MKMFCFGNPPTGGFFGILSEFFQSLFDVAGTSGACLNFCKQAANFLTYCFKWSGWLFQIFLIFTPTWRNDPI